MIVVICDAAAVLVRAWDADCAGARGCGCDSEAALLAQGAWDLRFGSRAISAGIGISRVRVARRVERSARPFVEGPSAHSEHRTGGFARSATLCCRDRDRLAA